MNKTSGAPTTTRAGKENFYFVIVLIATFLALALIVALTFGSFYKGAKENVVELGNSIVHQEASRIDSSLLMGLTTLQTATAAVEEMLTDSIAPADIEEHLITLSQYITDNIDPTFTGVYGVVNDVYVDGLAWKPEPGYDPYSRPWYKATESNGGKPTIVSPYIDAQTGKIMISFSQILSDGKSALSLDKWIDDIYMAASQINLNGKGYCFVTDLGGFVITHADIDEKGKNYLTDADADPETKLLTEKVLAANSKVVEMKLKGKDSFVFSSVVQDEWVVVLVVDKADLFADIRTSLIRNILISLAIFILVGYFCSSNYLNKRKALRYAEEVRTDNLTGLNNRGEFDRILFAMTSGVPEGKELHLLLLDADRFKLINDQYGHTEGDRALKYIATALDDVSARHDTFCARYGGDEFVVICICSDEEATALVAEYDAEISETSKRLNLPYNLSVSIGCARFAGNGQTATELIDNADKALYESKAKKRAMFA